MGDGVADIEPDTIGDGKFQGGVGILAGENEWDGFMESAKVTDDAEIPVVAGFCGDTVEDSNGGG